VKCEAAVAILASEGLALVPVGRQQARSWFIPFFVCFHHHPWHGTFDFYYQPNMLTRLPPWGIHLCLSLFARVESKQQKK